MTNFIYRPRHLAPRVAVPARGSSSVGRAGPAPDGPATTRRGAERADSRPGRNPGVRDFDAESAPEGDPAGACYGGLWAPGRGEDVAGVSLRPDFQQWLGSHVYVCCVV